MLSSKTIFWSLSIFFAFTSSTEAGTIQGNVNDSKGIPIGRVEITLHFRPFDQPESSYFKRTTHTNSEGNFVIEDLPAGSFQIVTAKKGWVNSEAWDIINEDQPSETRAVSVVMELTNLYLFLSVIQMSGLVYVMLFGLLVLGFNYFMAPLPSVGVTISGWSVIAGSFAIALVKVYWIQAVTLGVFGLVIGTLIQKLGRGIAAKRVARDDLEREGEESLRLSQLDEFQLLIGRVGTSTSDLKTCGSAEIDGKIVRVRSKKGFIPQGESVVVHSVEGKIPVVELQRS